MSYLLMDQIANDPDFQARVSACVVEQSNSLKNDERPDVSNLAFDCLRGADHAHTSFYRLGGVAMVTEGPGIPDVPHINPEGQEVESRKPGDTLPVDPPDPVGPPGPGSITDAQILSYVVHIFPTIASMWYSANGSPWSGALLPV